MLTTIYFDTPAIITPAVQTAFAHLGGLDVDNPQLGYRELTGYALKAPRTLSSEEVLSIGMEVAQLFGVSVEQPADTSNFRQVCLAFSQMADAMTGYEPGTLESSQDFDPAHTSTDHLLYGLLHWSYDGNNLANCECAPDNA